MPCHVTSYHLEGQWTGAAAEVHTLSCEFMLRPQGTTAGWTNRQCRVCWSCYSGLVTAVRVDFRVDDESLHLGARRVDGQS